MDGAAGVRRARRSASGWLRRPVLVAVWVVSLLAAGFLVYQGSNAAFTASTGTGSSFTGGTVVLTNDRSSSALFNVSGLGPGVTQTGCVNVTYTGSLDAQVRLYANVAGALAPYLRVTYTRGSFASAPGGGSCTGFIPDATDYIGDGPGVLFHGLLSDYPTGWGTALVDEQDTTGGPVQKWVTNETHAYRVQVTLDDVNTVQG